MAESVDSVTVQRFVRNLTFYLFKHHRDTNIEARAERIERIRGGHPIVIKSEVGVPFFLLWGGEQNWKMKHEQWTLKSDMRSFEVTGDSQAFTRDMTMLMMVGLDEIVPDLVDD